MSFRIDRRYARCVASCFCGCGTKVGLFDRDRRRANSLGSQIQTAIASVESEVRPWRESIDAFLNGARAEDGSTFAERTDAMIVQGPSHLENCRQIVHEQSGPGAAELDAAKDWLSVAQGLIELVHMSPEQQKVMLDFIAGRISASEYFDSMS